MTMAMMTTAKGQTGEGASAIADDILDEIGNDSFPASDPPGWPTTHLGPPCHCRESDRSPNAHEDKGP